jgi:hypothetical protein
LKGEFYIPVDNDDEGAGDNGDNDHIHHYNTATGDR